FSKAINSCIATNSYFASKTNEKTSCFSLFCGDHLATNSYLATNGIGETNLLQRFVEYGISMRILLHHPTRGLSLWDTRPHNYRYSIIFKAIPHRNRNNTRFLKSAQSTRFTSLICCTSCEIATVPLPKEFNPSTQSLAGFVSSSSSTVDVESGSKGSKSSRRKSGASSTGRVSPFRDATSCNPFSAFDGFLTGNICPVRTRISMTEGTLFEVNINGLNVVRVTTINS